MVQPARSAAEIDSELKARMKRPQRHRLLQGYPMAPLLKPYTPGVHPLSTLELDPARRLIVGVLPHTFCNPKVKGCGFCTFPHEQFGHEPLRRVVEQVLTEIDQTVLLRPSVRERMIDAIYFGGGTANLTPAADLERLARRLAAVFDISQAELTLEGVPRYFLLKDEALLEVLAKAPVRHRRLSMGVQTFDDGWLQKMGRDAFGDRAEMQRVVDAAHRRGFTVSADMLFNLPGAPRELGLADVRTAIELGFDQICAYNLVLTEELDTGWAKDAALVAAMPAPALGVEPWLQIRQRLLDSGYVQTTLTNFERAEHIGTPRAFLYEPAGFDPVRYDALGFGPGAISTFTDRDRSSAVKWVNAGQSAAFSEAMEKQQRAISGVFRYAPHDLRLLHLTRSIARLSIDVRRYRLFFGTSPLIDFIHHFEALEEQGLLSCSDEAITLTPRGMFFADAVAGLLAHDRIAALRPQAPSPEAIEYSMG